MTMKFKDFAAAFDFASKSGALKPTRPYRRLVWLDGIQVAVWCVTIERGIK